MVGCLLLVKGRVWLYVVIFTALVRSHQSTYEGSFGPVPPLLRRCGRASNCGGAHPIGIRLASYNGESSRPHPLSIRSPTPSHWGARASQRNSIKGLPWLLWPTFLTTPLPSLSLPLDLSLSHHPHVSLCVSPYIPLSLSPYLGASLFHPPTHTTMCHRESGFSTHGGSTPPGDLTNDDPSRSLDGPSHQSHSSSLSLALSLSPSLVMISLTRCLFSHVLPFSHSLSLSLPPLPPSSSLSLTPSHSLT